ncbi:hypothetical protein SSCG_01195 [Streptomyces clavuligerus]|nr:hypothetical protein SSCG_01195 [Streptomyces clavuligerus]
MVTFAQAQERADEWVNGDVPPYQQREVRVREFELGFVVWAEDREGGGRADGGGQRLVIARDSGEATLWPGLPVGEVIRRYEEEYGVRDAAPAAVPEQQRRIDQHQTSFLLSPPEWLEDEAEDDVGTTAAGLIDASFFGFFFSFFFLDSVCFLFFFSFGFGFFFFFLPPDSVYFLCSFDFQ